MKVKHLIFFLFVSVFIAALSFMPSVEISNGNILKREELWAYGFGPAGLVLGLVLAIASISAWRGSPAAAKFCLMWGGFYSLVVGGLSIWHFPNTIGYTIVVGVAWAVLWFFSVRRWVRNVGV